MTDRPLDLQELEDLKSGKTLTHRPYFINVFKNDVIEPNGRNDYQPPSLYEMVLLELLAKLEVLENQVVVDAVKIKHLERD